jgi:hypothetical protein
VSQAIADPDTVAFTVWLDALTALVAVRREQRDEQLFWLTLLESIRHTVEGGLVEEPTQRYPAVLRRGDARSSALGARRLSPSPPAGNR